MTNYSARPVGKPGCSCRLPQPGQLTIGEELLGYHIGLSQQQPIYEQECLKAFTALEHLDSLKSCFHNPQTFL